MAARLLLLGPPQDRVGSRGAPRALLCGAEQVYAQTLAVPELHHQPKAAREERHLVGWAAEAAQWPAPLSTTLVCE